MSSGRGVKLWPAVNATTVVLFVVVLVACTARFYGASPDFGWHLLLANFISGELRMPGEGDRSLLALMVDYPSGGHLSAALLGHLLGSNVHAVHTLGVLAMMSAYLAIGRALIVPSIWLSCLALALYVSILWAFSAPHFLGFEIVRNYFFSQILGDAALLWAALATVRLKRRPVIRAAVAFLLCLVISDIYTLSAIKFLFCLIVLGGIDVVSERRSRMVAINRSMILVCVATAALLIHPKFFPMLRIGQYEGGITGSLGAVISWSTVCLVGASALAWRRWAGTGGWQDDWLVAVGAGLAIAALGQTAAFYLMGIGSKYAVLKHSFGLGSMSLAILIRLFSSLVFSKLANAPGSPRKCLGTAFASVVALTVYSGDAVRATRSIVLYDSDLRHIIRSGTPPDAPGATVSYNKDLGPELNLALAIANLRTTYPLRLEQIELLSGKMNITAKYAVVGRKETYEACTVSTVPLVISQLILARCLDQPKLP